MNVQQRVDETAFVMLGMPPARRECVFRDAFARVLAKHPDLTEIPPFIVAYTAAVYARIAELEQQGVGHA